MPPTTEPTGSEGAFLVQLRDAIASTATFQTWVGAANEAAAKDSIWFESAPLDSDLHPLCLIGYGPTWGQTRRGVGPVDHYRDSAVVAMSFHELVPDAIRDQDNEHEATIQFMNDVVGIVDELLTVTGAVGITSLTRIGRPTRTAPESREDVGDYMGVFYNVGFGLEAGGEAA